MMKYLNDMKKAVALILVFSFLVSSVGCSSEPPTTVLSDPTSQVFTENIETENIETETVLTEFITSEIYLEEIVLAEETITELLLEEETIEEVLLCQTIYVPQEHIEEFADNSQIAGLFGGKVELKPVLKKLAVGTGIIITLVILKTVGGSGPIASMVVAAAEKSLQFAKSGAVIGSLFGGFTGAFDEIDPSGRTSAAIGFATATAGLIIAIVSLITAIPSGGASAMTLAAGVKLVLAGVKVIAATTATIMAASNAVKTFTTTDPADIDWNNIDWEKVGYSSIQKAIQNGADGYMWGAILGAIEGGVEGFEYYQKYNTPYTSYRDRINGTPKNGDKGRWTGERGESDFVLDEPIELPDGTKITQITYRNGVPDFSPYQKAQVRISNMTNKRLGPRGNYEKADTALAELWNQMRYNGKTTWTARDVEAYRTQNNLTWHEMSNMEYMQLVPYELNHTFNHYGGVAEYNAMIGQGGTDEFD